MKCGHILFAALRSPKVQGGHISFVFHPSHFICVPEAHGAENLQASRLERALSESAFRSLLRSLVAGGRSRCCWCQDARGAGIRYYRAGNLAREATSISALYVQQGDAAGVGVRVSWITRK